MKLQATQSIADATPGDGSFAGARKLYLERALKMTLLERLRAAEGMAETARLIHNAAQDARSRQ